MSLRCPAVTAGGGRPGGGPCRISWWPLRPWWFVARAREPSPRAVIAPLARVREAGTPKSGWCGSKGGKPPRGKSRQAQSSDHHRQHVCGFLTGLSRKNSVPAVVNKPADRRVGPGRAGGRACRCFHIPARSFPAPLRRSARAPRPVPARSPGVFSHCSRTNAVLTSC
jgi:hypothetical protein